MKWDVEKGKQLLQKIGKDKLVLLALAGVLLLLSAIPGDSETKEQETVQSQVVTVSTGTDSSKYVEELEQRLAKMIAEIQGVDNVKVMITLQKSEEKEVLKEEDIVQEDTAETDSNGGERKITSYQKDETTIYSKDSDGQETPYVIAEKMPDVCGVAVIADGADDPVIKEKIISLIKALFGIEINKIMVTA